MARSNQSPAKLSDVELAQLLQRCAQGERAAFAAFYQATQGQMYGYALGILHDEGRAQECLQEVYLAVWRHAARYHVEKASAMTWLAAITHHRAISYVRRYQREVSVDDWVEFLEIGLEGQALDALVAVQPGHSDWQMLSQGLLENCLNDLDHSKRQAVQQAFFGDCTYSEISSQMNKPLNTIKSWVRRALFELRRCLEHKEVVL